MVQTKQEESRKYYLKNKERIREYQRTWEKTNPTKLRENGLGRFDDDKEILFRAIQYLEHYEIS